MAYEELSLDEFVSSIAKKLRFLKEDATVVAIHKERVPENAKKPYISINDPISTLTPEMRNRAELKVTVFIRVHDIDDSTNIRKYMRNIKQRIEPTLFKIPIKGTLLRCRRFTSEVVDDILNVQADYSLKVIIGGENQDKVFMQTLDLETTVRK